MLENNIKNRSSLVFISAQPAEYGQNDADSDEMHEMFAERNLAFESHFVIDNRTSSAEAEKLIKEASCIF